MLYLALYILVFLLWMGIEILNAPKGEETENGFRITEDEENAK